MSVRITAGILLRDPERSEGHVSSNDLVVRRWFRANSVLSRDRNDLEYSPELYHDQLGRRSRRRIMRHYRASPREASTPRKYWGVS
jgi:hypothetical protein